MSVAAAALSTLLARGLLDYYAYNGGEAYRTYAQAAVAYPDAAMAYWGEALALGPNFNEPLTRENFEAAQPAILKALSLAATATPRDRDLIATLALRYAGTWDRHEADDNAYRAALAPLVVEYPDDDTVAMLYAEALADGDQGWHSIAELAATVLARNPQHPMANHLCIHAYDDTADRTPAIPCARRLDAMTFAPPQEHLAHMPAHTWIETGAYALAEASSERAYALIVQLTATPDADQDHIRYTGHDIAIDFTSAMYLGNYAQAIGWHDRSHANTIASLVLARFGRWNEIMSFSRVGDSTLAMARALALTHLARWDEARAAYNALGRERKDSILGVLTNARLAEHDGKVETAISDLRWVAKQQFGNYSAEYLPTFPAIEAVGFVYLRAGRYADAVNAFNETLQRYPEDPRALYGLSNAYAKQGMESLAADAQTRFDRQWSGADTAPSIDDF